MTRFAEKLDGLLDTVCLVSAIDLTDFAEALKSSATAETLAVGSGGSAITARYFARCRETLFGKPTEVMTALEFVVGSVDLAGHHVWVFTAGADNPDSMATVIAARARGATLHMVTRNIAGQAARLASATPGSRIFEVPVAEPKDGFLATHSLIASVIAILLASDAASEDPIGEALRPQVMRALQRVLDPEFRTMMAERFESLRSTDVLLLIGDPQVRAIAELVETSAWEAAICPVQLTDVRNFAHGRHSWLHHRADSTFLLSLTSYETSNIWECAESLLPAIRRAVFDFGDAGRIRVAIGLVEGLIIVEAMGRAVGIDPGKPGIGCFGRDLYADASLLQLSKDLRPSLRQKRAAVLARDDLEASQQSIRAAGAARLSELAAAPIGGVVLDYDGTIISDEERFGVPRNSIAKELVRLDALGVRFAIATGRGGSGGKALRAVLPTELHNRVVIGYYNGAYIQQLTVDIENLPPPVDVAIAETFEWLQAHPEFFIGEPKGRFSNVQISVKLENLADFASLPLALRDCPPVESGAVKFAQSGHSIDFSPASTSKRHVVERLRAEVPDGHAIVCIGDCGDRGGNDHELLSHAFGVSVGTVCGRHEGCWSLYGKRLVGPEALLNLLSAMRRDSDGEVRIDIDALGLDSFAQ